MQNLYIHISTSWLMGFFGCVNIFRYVQLYNGKEKDENRKLFILFAVLLNAGLIMVDRIFLILRYVHVTRKIYLWNYSFDSTRSFRKCNHTLIKWMSWILFYFPYPYGKRFVTWVIWYFITNFLVHYIIFILFLTLLKDMHFQYNGFLFTFLILSITDMQKVSLHTYKNC